MFAPVEGEGEEEEEEEEGGGGEAVATAGAGHVLLLLVVPVAVEAVGARPNVEIGAEEIVREVVFAGHGVVVVGYAGQCGIGSRGHREALERCQTRNTSKLRLRLRPRGGSSSSPSSSSSSSMPAIHLSRFPSSGLVLLDSDRGESTIFLH